MGLGDVYKRQNKAKEHLTADSEVYKNPEKYFDQVIEINLNELTPHINCPFTPDLATPVSEMKSKAKSSNWPVKIEWGLIGSCTNSSYEDLSRAASIAKQAVEKKLNTKADFGINPGSEQVRYTAERDGLLEIFEKLNAKIFPPILVTRIKTWGKIIGEALERYIHQLRAHRQRGADGGGQGVDLPVPQGSRHPRGTVDRRETSHLARPEARRQ